MNQSDLVAYRCAMHGRKAPLLGFLTFEDGVLAVVRGKLGPEPVHGVGLLTMMCPVNRDHGLVLPEADLRADWQHATVNGPQTVMLRFREAEALALRSSRRARPLSG